VIDLPEQPLAERVLNRVLGREDPPQQLLFLGPPGTGKRDTARRVAWQLILPGRPFEPHRELMDLSVVRGTGALIRLEADLDPALADLAARPAVGERRVVIIEGAERLREEDAAPRILKILEEPPQRSFLILVTDRAADLLPTIRSRCLPVPFRTPAWRALARRLEESGLTPEAAEAAARADGPLALSADPFARRMRTLGADLALSALAGQAGGGVVRAVQAAMAAAADDRPSAELVALRAEAERLAGKRGERTAVKRVDDQEKRERRRAVTDGWGHLLDGAAGLIGDALVLCVGAEAAVRRRDRLDDLRPLATPARQAFLERALEEVQLTRSELELNPTNDLAAEGLLGRIAAARRGQESPLIAPGRLGP
jgi:DNA polymerase-3 subunit delta'